MAYPELSVDIQAKRPADPFLNLKEGTVICDRYIVQRLLGRGASGSVYQCTDHLISDLSVAVKLFARTANNDVRLSRRIYREMLTCNNISHPNVTKFYDCIHSEEFIGYSMEYVDGRSIQSYIEAKENLDLPTAFRLFRQIIQGLQSVHSIGVIHRDIKPSNILCTSGGYIKISDFGIATQRTKTLQIIEGLPSFHSAKNDDRPADTYTYTEQGRFVGTPRYLSPEYIEHGYTDFRSDLYAAGIILYELITKNYPFKHTSLPELLQRKVEDIPVSPCEYRKDCPSSLNRFILALIAKNPNDRFDSAVETIDALNVLEKNLGRTEIFISAMVGTSGLILQAKGHENGANGGSSSDNSSKNNSNNRIGLPLMFFISLLCCFGCVVSITVTQSDLAQDLKHELGDTVVHWLQGLLYLVAKT